MLTVIFALAGAIAGRLVARVREDADEGQADDALPGAVAPGAVAPGAVASSAMVRPQDIVPGLIAALRVSDRPWSYLHLPPWLAAFAVNLLAGAFRRELSPVLVALGFNIPSPLPVTLPPPLEPAAAPPPPEPATAPPPREPDTAPSPPAVTDAPSASAEPAAGSPPTGPGWTPTGPASDDPASDDDQPPGTTDDPDRPEGAFTPFTS